MNNIITSALEYMSEMESLNSHKQASCDKANEISIELFGEELAEPVESIGKCPMYLYDVNTKMFFYPEPRCGGTSNIFVKSYKAKFTEKGNEAYVYVNYELLEDTQINGVNSYRVYKDFDYPEDTLMFGRINYKNEYQTSSIIYNLTNFNIDSTNHQGFSEYKYKFNKDSNDNYYFVSVEQTK